MTRLTGRTKYRETWFGRLVLQVEVCTTYISPVDEYDWFDISWRDARAEDFTDPTMRGLFRKSPMPYPGQRPVTEPQTGECGS